MCWASESYCLGPDIAVCAVQRIASEPGLQTLASSPALVDESSALGKVSTTVGLFRPRYRYDQLTLADIAYYRGGSLPILSSEYTAAEHDQNQAGY